MSITEQQFFRVWPNERDRAVRYYVRTAEEALKKAVQDGHVCPLKIVDGITDERFILRDGQLIANGRQCYACGMG
jgi:hypothetical protein